MTKKISFRFRRMRRALLSATVVGIAAPQLASAQALSTLPGDRQDEGQPRVDMMCWRGAPPPACGGFVVVEMQGVMPLAQSTRGQRDTRLETFESRLEWNLGYMGNVSERWAMGGTLSLGTGASDVLSGVRARARRWFDRQRSLEFEAGMVRVQAPFQPGDLSGATAGVRFNVRDRASLFVRWDWVDVPPFSFPGGLPDDPGGSQQALHVGVGTGSSWALLTTGALGVGYLVLIALLLGSGYS